LQAFEFESNGSWCELAQHVIAGLSAADDGKLQITVETRPMDTFEHGHTNYSQVSGGGLKVKIISAFENSSGFGPADIHGAAKSIDCKMLGADRVAEQMKVKTNMSVTCRDVNPLAVAKALELLPESRRSATWGRSGGFVTGRTPQSLGTSGRSGSRVQSRWTKRKIA